LANGLNICTGIGTYIGDLHICSTSTNRANFTNFTTFSGTWKWAAYLMWSMRGEGRCGCLLAAPPVQFPVDNGCWSVTLQQWYLCGGYSYDSTSIRRAFDCLSKVIKFIVT